MKLFWLAVVSFSASFVGLVFALAYWLYPKMGYFGSVLLILSASTASAELRLLRFTQAGCPACRQMAPVWASIDPALPTQDIDTNAHPGITRALGVATTPTAVIADVDEKGNAIERRRLVGVQSRANVIRFLGP